MARKFVSPGVFTQEIDRSYLAQGVANIGAAVLGRTLKGPAFTPVLVSDFNDFVSRFGDVDPKLQAPYAAKNYLKNASGMQMVRVLGSRDGAATNGWADSVGYVTAITASGGEVLAEIHYVSPADTEIVGMDDVTPVSATFTSGAANGYLQIKAKALGALGAGTQVILQSSASTGVISVVGKVITVGYLTSSDDLNDIATAINANGSASALVVATTASAGSNTVTAPLTWSLTGALDASAEVSFSFANFPNESSGVFNFDSSSPDYITNVLNTDPTKVDKYGHYVFKHFAWAGEGTGPGVIGYGTASLVAAAQTSSYDYDYTTPESPWITSQYGDQLFKFITISDGDAANYDVKVTITGIKKSPYPSVTEYGTFDVVVRSYSDTDNRLVALETFTQVTLDPTSPNYLPRVIGDQYVVWNSTNRKNVVNGTYINRSRFIYVEMGTANTAKDSLPWGHTGYPIQYATVGEVVATPWKTSNIDSQGNVTPTYWGLDFTADGVESLQKALAHESLLVEASSSTTDGFSMSHLVQVTSVGGIDYLVYNEASSTFAPTTDSVDGFTVAFAGGFDGWDLSSANPTPTGSLTAYPVASKSYKLALDSISNPDEVDLNLLALPGINDDKVAGYASALCNDRADCMYIRDLQGASVSAAVSKINSLAVDDNYTATYYPNLRYSDSVNGVQVEVTPSVAILGAYAYSDRVGQVYFAPAGLNRGGLAAFNIVDVADRLTFQDRNDLYEARINPIASFPNEGIVVFGQKTLQAKPSALDRVNVRRLLIYAKKTIASAAKYLLFEPNNPATWQRFLSTVNPILDNIRQNQGLERFKVVMDSTTNTPDLIDRNIMTGKIFLQPTRAAEFIDLSFIITASGVSFEE